VIIPFYKLYTPYDILGSAEFTTEYSQLTSTAITFGTSTVTSERLFKLPLIPAGMLYRNSDIVVVVTVGMDNENRGGNPYDSDPLYFLSDGKTGIGFVMRDEGTHCHALQATMGDTLTSFTSGSGSTHESAILPEQFVFTFKPSQRWGLCYIAADSGVVNPNSYTPYLHLDQGLWLEVYREDKYEQYTINYIKVEIHEN